MTEVHSGSGDINKSLALMWDVDDRAGTPGPKPRLTLDAIVEQAVAVADAEGLDAVSMRRIAADLGVGAMSLYRYLPGKEELLDLMIEHVSALDEADGALPLPWPVAMRALGHSLWRFYTAHRWLPTVDQSRPLLGPNALAGLEVSMAALEDSPWTDQEKIGIVASIDALVVSLARGHNSEVLAEERTGVSSDEFWKAQGPVLEKAMTSGRFPRLAALDENSFEPLERGLLDFALEALVTGLEQIAAVRPRPGDPS
jgi:AcrR family transcriptional regulator